MRLFLIRVLQVVALAMIGTSFIADTSHARTSKQQLAAFCSQVGGEFVDDVRTGTYSCLWTGYGEGNTPSSSAVSCRPDGTCFQSVCGRGGCAHVYDKDYSGKKVKGPTPSKRDDVVVDVRGFGGKSGTVSGNATETAVGSPKPAPSKTNIKLSGTASDASMGLSKTNTKPVLSNTAKPPLLWGGSAFGTRAGQVPAPSAARQLQ